MSALKESITDIREEDVVYVSFKNDYYELPFYIIIDHQTKSYVLTLRGTYSGQDIITDLTGWPVPMNTPGLPSTFSVQG
jgi:sn1-specific diacylglycerol lipase